MNCLNSWACPMDSRRSLTSNRTASRFCATRKRFGFCLFRLFSKNLNNKWFLCCKLVVSDCVQERGESDQDRVSATVEQVHRVAQRLCRSNKHVYAASRVKYPSNLIFVCLFV